MKLKDIKIKKAHGLLEMPNEVLNAEIGHIFLGDPDYGYMTVIISLDYAYGSQGFGTQDLRGRNSLHWFLNNVFKIVGVSNFNDLKDKKLRVLRVGQSIIAIGNWQDDEWFCPEQEWSVMNLLFLKEVKELEKDGS